MKFFLFLFLASPTWAVNLNQAVESSLQKNETVEKGRAELLQADERVGQARGLIFPNVSLIGTYLRQPKSTDNFSGQIFPEEQKTASLTLTQPLFRGLREFAGLRREDHYYRAQKQIYVSQIIQLYQDVAQSFMNVLSLEQDLRNLEAQQKIYEARVIDLKGRAHRGESSSSEVLTAEATSAALNAEYQIQSSKLKAARENFSFLTGLPLNTVLDESTQEKVSIDLKPLDVYLARIDERPDIKKQKELTEAADQDVSIARGAHWPTLDLTGNYYLVRPDGYSSDNKWDIQLTAKLPLFEGGLTQSQVRSAASKYGSQQLELNQLRRQSESEIKSLHQSVQMRVDQLKYLKISSDLSEKNYQTLLRDSRRGLVRSIDVQMGLTEFRSAKRAYDQARFEAQLERIRLDLAAAFIPHFLTKELE